MKVFFVFILLVTHSGLHEVKIPFSYTLRHITCEESFLSLVTHEIPYTYYKKKLVGLHYCKDMNGEYYWGYPEQLDYDLR